MSDELKPCPFCGGENVTNEFDDPFYSVICGICGASSAFSDEEGAVRLWNARAAVADEQFSLAIHDGRAWQAVRECRMSPARGGGWYCSECSVWVAPGPMANATEHLAPRYCPNCGAKVVG